MPKVKIKQTKEKKSKRIFLNDINNNELQTLDEGNSKVIKAILNEDGTVLVANEDGTINEWDINNKMIVKEYPKIDAQITDIYLSKTYGKIYASSHEGIFTINLETNELRREDIENKNYNQILVPRRNEAILVCDEKEVDGWDVYEMRRAYNRHHQQNQEGQGHHDREGPLILNIDVPLINGGDHHDPGDHCVGGGVGGFQTFIPQDRTVIDDQYFVKKQIKGQGENIQQHEDRKIAVDF